MLCLYYDKTNSDLVTIEMWKCLQLNVHNSIITLYQNRELGAEMEANTTRTFINEIVD